MSNKKIEDNIGTVIKSFEGAQILDESSAESL